MIAVRRVHAAAAVVNGVALAAAALGRPILCATFCCTSVLLLVWAQEKMRFHLSTREPRR